jgi:hypothetical protein
MASPAARKPGPLVTLVRCLTVANVDSIGFVIGIPENRPDGAADVALMRLFGRQL